MMNIRVIFAIGALTMVMPVSAEVLTDPTRPPTAMIPASAMAAGTFSGPVLQSVLVSQGRKIAIISGKEVKVNDKYNGARVVRITDTEVVLRNGRQVQVLKLFPDVKKQMVQGEASSATDGRSVKKRGKE